MSKAVCVFCGASNNAPKEHLDIGTKFGEMLAREGIRLVYGGGDCGVMGTVANAVLRNNGKVTGVFPRSLKNIESEHASLSEIIMVESMHERKRIMFERSDAVVVLPGGFGTMDEMFEIITWKQLQFHNKPVVILNNQGYWDPLVSLMDNIIETGFAKYETRSLYRVVNTIDEALQEVR
ncbi:MAG TPA: TIGR00730 family Rossman fold protein [Rickettsiales bacterium]|nr:TIGR00730 family Rossman fold protein [Rickettsiales bacterium]